MPVDVSMVSPLETWVFGQPRIRLTRLLKDAGYVGIRAQARGCTRVVFVFLL